jgi:stage III sporulation protein AC
MHSAYASLEFGGLEMNVDILLKIAGIGMIAAILHIILEQANKKEYAWMVTVVGVMAALGVVVQMVGQLFNNVRAVFQLW